jgi:mycothiol system anti-sigma-R factor
MSIPDQSKMKQDCSNQKSCLEKLQSILDDEATKEEKEHFFKHHLEECMPCYRTYHLELEIRELLKKKCNEHAPQDIIESIKARISSQIPS